MHFQQELLEPILPELIPLFEKNFSETAPHSDIPLNPQYDKFVAMNRDGLYRFFTARDDHGVIVGYCGFWMSPSFHYYPSLQASQDLFFIKPERRGFGHRFLKWMDAQLSELGVQLVYQHVSAKHDWSLILDRMGYNKIETVYSRRLS